jgi:hypothetical protein
MDSAGVAALLREQDGVISRRQVLALGGSDNDIERLLRRREWARVHPGTYVDHTGPPSWRQLAWAAILHHWPSALAGASALRWSGLRISDGMPGSTAIELVVPVHRAVDPGRRITARRVKEFDRITGPALVPPRVRIEHAVLDVASRARREDAEVAVLADACQTRRTTPERLVEALALLPRLRHRRLMLDILEDVASGAYSGLERRYLVRVERPHGLPTAQRQRRVSVGRSVAYRDVEYVELGTIVELDGKLGHEAAGDRWRDLDRDVQAVVGGAITLRVGWLQALQACRLAAAVGAVLGARGWDDVPRRCGPTCSLPEQ